MNEEYKRTKEVNAQRDRESKKGRRKKIQAFRAYIIFIIIWRLKEKKKKTLDRKKQSQIQTTILSHFFQMIY